MPTAEQKLAVIDDLGRFQRDPLGYVLYAFPWGSGPLKDHAGPRRWQRDVLRGIGEKLKAGGDLGAVIQEAVASGHGIGKSALVAWVILWAMSTFEDTRGVVTASTDTQLRTKTWPEVTKWHRMAINDWMFTITATALYSSQKGADKTWRIDAVPWSETNSEAFAGLHNEGRRILVVYDEASSIADAIWEVTEGALTDERTEIIWAAFGNPTRNTGRFKDCFGRFKHRWHSQHIDSRTVEGINLSQAQGWVDDWGEDSDFVRVRVRGEFPKASSLQFISEADVERARRAEAFAHAHEPLILGVDVARFGDDQSVIFARRGRDWRTWNQSKGIPDSGPWCYRGMDTMQLASRVCEVADLLKADAIMVDGGGVGGGVVDRLRALHREVFDVQFGAAPDTASIDATGAVGEKYANKRAEMWGAGRTALKSGVAIPDDPDLAAELCAVEYSFNVRDEILLEPKASMKKRGLSSPDVADAAMLTFAYPVSPKLPLGRLTGARHQSDYDPYAG
jgi:hypothetical protein